MKLNDTPKCYFTHGAGKWAVIFQGLPICADKATYAEALAAAKQCKVTPDLSKVWTGDYGRWQVTSALWPA